MTDKVVFRAWRAGGDVIALFPRIPGDNAGYLCNAYEHVGQHGAADWDVVLRRTRPARHRRGPGRPRPRRPWRLDGQLTAGAVMYGPETQANS